MIITQTKTNFSVYLTRIDGIFGDVKRREIDAHYCANQFQRGKAVNDGRDITRDNTAIGKGQTPYMDM